MIIKESEKIEKLTKKLVSINSVNNDSNKGESKVAKYIYDYFSKNAYFKKHPNQLMMFDSENNRHSTIAYIKGKTNKTIVLMGHIDTVEIEDYGKAKKYACNPDKICDELKKHFNLDKKVLEDIKSNKYMFARGALDMKSGVAVNMTIIDYFTKHLDKLNGSLLLLAECDEEGDSKGVISALDKLVELKEKEQLEYKACINTDYSVSDNNERFMYLGTVGKLLPSFVCIGKESHVGSPFKGFDPNLLLSVLNKNISLNADLADKVQDKTSVPPICLKQSDFKQSYTVQTAGSAYAYFNYMLYTSSPVKVMNNCLKVAKNSFKETIDLLNTNYKKYCKNNKLVYQKLPYEVNVYTFKEFDDYLRDSNPNYKEDIKIYAKKLVKDNPNIDIREYSYKLVLKAYEYYELKKPVLIVYFGSTFYSNIETKDKKLREAVYKSADMINEESKYDIKVSDFYPYISDMSYLSCPHSSKDIKAMLNNCPYYEYHYDYPYEKIKQIEMPTVNIGTYGFDGHTFIERMEKDYCFKELPNLVYTTIINYFND